MEIGDTEYHVAISLENYWRYLDEGTPPHWPPVSRLRQWIQVKPVKAFPDKRGRIPSVNQLAYLIGRKISRDGTKATNFFRGAERWTEEAFRSRIEAAIREDLTAAIGGVLQGAGLTSLK